MTDPIAAALDELVPPFESARADWEAILDAASPAGEARHRLAWGRRSRRRWRPLLIAVALVAALAVAGAAIADGIGAFDGIGAAQHPQTGADVIDPATAAYMEGKSCGPGRLHPVCMPIPAGLLLDTARHIGQLPDGRNVYVITRTYGDLCTVVGPPYPEWECNSPLSRSHPSTIFTYGDNPAGTPSITFGVALDGVTSVSFQPDYPNGQEVTVPVEDNLWTYEAQSPPYLLQPMTVHFADGTTVVEPGRGTNCAAC